MNPFPMVLADLRALRWTAPAIVLLVALAIATGVAIAAQERALRRGSAAAANDFDLIIGAPGSQTQLLMSTVYVQPDALPLVDGRLLNTLFKDERVAQVAPIAFGDVSRGYPIVGTTAAFAGRWDRIKPSEGRLFAAEGEAVLGADVLYRMSDTITPSHGVAGLVAAPGQTDAEEDSHKHEGHGYTVVGRLPRTASRLLVESVVEELDDLWAEIRDTLESFTKTQNPDANESHSGCHIQNSNPESLSDSENSSGKYEEAATFAETANVRSLPKRDLPLGIVLDACPNLRELGQGGQIRHWRDLLAAAEAARPMLGVSPSAWKEALEVLGEQQAAITLAAIYERSAQINNAGGYLRSLTERARDGKFSTWPMVMALLRAKLDAAKPGQPAGTGHGYGQEGRPQGGGQFQMSDALRRSLEKPKW